MIIDVLSSDVALQEFIKLPSSIYRDDPNYIVEPSWKTQASLFRECFTDRQAAFLVRNGSETVGRVVARISPILRDSNDDSIGMLGFFESQNAPDDVGQLLAAATDWLHDFGVKTIVGPMDGDTWHRYRFNTGPFERPPFLMEPYNKPYYDELWRRAGFEQLEAYYSIVVDDPSEAAAPLASAYHRVRDAGYRLRAIEMNHFEAEIEVIYRLSTTIFADNFLYEEITLQDFLDLYRPARSLVDPDLVLIAETESGDPAGFVFSIVDYHAAVASMRGRSGLLAKLRFLFNRRKASAVNMKSLGILPEHRRSGLAAALMYESYQVAIRKGIRQANLCLIREGNPSGRLDGNAGTVSRHYVLYQYSGEAK